MKIRNMCRSKDTQLYKLLIVAISEWWDFNYFSVYLSVFSKWFFCHGKVTWFMLTWIIYIIKKNKAKKKNYSLLVPRGGKLTVTVSWGGGAGRREVIALKTAFRTSQPLRKSGGVGAPDMCCVSVWVWVCVRVCVPEDQTSLCCSLWHKPRKLIT